MLKNRNDRPCDCGSGKKFAKCCGHPVSVKAKKLTAGRDCGDCQACCHLVGVGELGKPYATRCEHQCATGCAIYQARPYGCRVFECKWRLLPDMPLELRPDKSGIMCVPDRFDHGFAQFFFEVWENAFGQTDDAFFELMLRLLDLGEKIVLVPFGSSNGTAYQTAPKYMDNDKFQKPQQVHTNNGRIYVLCETVAEADDVLKRIGLSQKSSIVRPSRSDF